VRLPSKQKGARLSLARIGSYYWQKMTKQLKLTTRFVRAHLPPPRLRVIQVADGSSKVISRQAFINIDKAGAAGVYFPHKDRVGISPITHVTRIKVRISPTIHLTSAFNASRVASIHFTSRQKGKRRMTEQESLTCPDRYPSLEKVREFLFQHE
jgi:hypothetical protein